MIYIPAIQKGGFYENPKDREKYLLLGMERNNRKSILKVYEEGNSLNELAHRIVKNPEKREEVLKKGLGWIYIGFSKKEILKKLSEQEGFQLKNVYPIYSIRYLQFKNKIKKGLSPKNSQGKDLISKVTNE